MAVQNRYLALTMLVFCALMLTAYFGLVTYFQFPDVLRLPTADMMEIFIDKQAKVVGFYYVFVLSQIAFIGLVLLMHHYLRQNASACLTLSTGFGALAGLCQAIGFTRWPFLVPYLAGIVQDPASTEAMRESALIVFQSFHYFAGVAIGENLFFVLEAFWAVFLAIHLYIKQVLPTRLILIPVLSGVCILVYSTEQFGGFLSVLGPLNVIAHAALVFWFVALAVTLLSKSELVNAQTKVHPITTAVVCCCYVAIVAPSFFSN